MRKLLQKWRKLNNSGVTLVELVCAMAIIVILAGAVAGIMVVSSNTYARGTAEIALQEEAQLLSNQVERLVQFASEAAWTDGPSVANKGGSLTIKQASSGTEYVLTHDASNHQLNYTDTSSGSTALLAEHIDSVVFDVTNFDDDGVVIMTVCVCVDDYDPTNPNQNSFQGSFTISSRNIARNNNIPGGDITMTITEEYVLEPNQTQPLSAQMSDGSGIDWLMTGNNDSRTEFSVDPATGKKTISISKDEDANIIYLTARSQRKMPDGVTPLVEKTVSIYVRRVTDVALDFINETTGNKTRNGRSGEVYKLTAEGTGNNLENKAPAITDPGYENEDGTDGLYKTVNTKDIIWSLKLIIKGETKYEKEFNGNYSDSYVTCTPVESIYAGPSPSLKLKLNFNLDTGDQIVVTAKAKHPLGGIERTDASGNTYTEKTNLVTAQYDDVSKTWVLYRDVYRYNGNGFSRASDDPQGEIYVDNIINILRAYYGNDRVNSEAWNSEKIMRSHRFREVTVNEEGEILTAGPWTNWRYLGTSSQQDKGNSLNMRPDATASLDCDKSYQVQLRLFVLDRNGNEVYPIPGVTEEDEYMVTGIVNPVSISVNATYSGVNWSTQYLLSKSVGGACTAPAGVDIKISRAEVKYIKNDPDKMLLSFNIQREKEDGTWENVSSFQDNNNFNDPYAVYLRMNGNGQGTDGIDAIAFHHKGNYRVLMSHVKVPYTRYVPATDSYVVTGNTRDYQYYDEVTGKGVFYFSINENSSKWNEKFIEFEGKVYLANDYFVCNNKLYEKKKFKEKTAWDGHGNQLMYYTENGNSGEMFVSVDRETYNRFTYSYKGSDPKTFTVNSTTFKSKDEMNKSGLPEVIKQLIKEKVGW